jgi:hypothetical protein
MSTPEISSDDAPEPLSGPGVLDEVSTADLIEELSRRNHMVLVYVAAFDTRMRRWIVDSAMKGEWFHLLGALKTTEMAIQHEISRQSRGKEETEG